MEDVDCLLDRLSGLWGPQTPLGLFLMENEITTLFFGGVNADQCVVCLACCPIMVSIAAYCSDNVVVVYLHRRLLQGIRCRLCRGHLRHHESVLCDSDAPV
jgi:hypothetical protein